MRIDGLFIYAEIGKKIARKSACQYAEDYGSAFPLGELTERDFVEVKTEKLPANRPTEEESYDEKVNNLIRERYSLSNELAVLRQRDSKPDEWAAYNAYCEDCKRKAREEGAR